MYRSSSSFYFYFQFLAHVCIILEASESVMALMRYCPEGLCASRLLIHAFTRSLVSES